MIASPVSRDIEARLRKRLRLRDLELLSAVAQHGSMAKAAQHQAVSQPAVSKAIAELERTVGVTLFERTTRGVEPTLYGQVLLKWTAAIFDDLRQGTKEIEFLSDPTAGEIRIGAVEPMLGGFLPVVLRRLTHQFPRVTVDITQPVSLDQQHQDLRQRSVDLVLGRLAIDDTSEDLESELLFEEPWSIVAGTKNPVARRPKLDLADLLDEPWSLPPSDTVLTQYLLRGFAAAGVGPPRSVVTCTSIQMHYALISDGPFLAVFPRSLLKFGNFRTSLKVLPVQLPGFAPPVGITMLKRRIRHPVVDLFIEHARAVGKQLKD